MMTIQDEEDVNLVQVLFRVQMVVLAVSRGRSRRHSKKMIFTKIHLTAINY